MLTDDFFVLYTGNRHLEDECAFINGSHMTRHLNRELLDCTTDDPITPSRVYGMQFTIPPGVFPSNGISLVKEIRLNGLSDPDRGLSV
jgi:hypothetical protein